jgi:hypothetical protein
MKYFRTITWVLLSTLAVTPVAAALLDCPDVVHTALAVTDELCDGTGRNEACYGHIHLDAQPQPGVDDFAFSEVGDQVDVTAIQSLRLSPLEPETGAWGVALMRLQASLPASEPDDLTVLLFGDVEIENAVDEPTTSVDVTVSVDEFINVRRGPTLHSGAVGVLAPGDTVTAVERLESGLWLRVLLPRTEVAGWLRTDLVTPEGDLEDLRVSEPWTPHYRPMQAFYFQSGEETQPGCPEAPTSGMIIQTPEGVGQVTLLINEVNIRIGSTAFFEAPGDELRVSTVEGTVEVEAMGVTSVAHAGSQVSVPLDEHHEPSAPPRRAQPYNAEQLQELPVETLDRDIGEIAEPLTQEEIDVLVGTELLVPTDEPTATGPEVPQVLAPVSTGGLSVESVCVGRWRVRNSTAQDVSFTWDKVGNGQSGGGIAPAGGSTSFSTSGGSGERVSINYDGGSSSASSNGESCNGESAPQITPSVEATSEVQPGSDDGSGGGSDDSEPPTAVPPTAEPPTSEPPPVEPPTSEAPPPGVEEPPVNEPPPPVVEPPTSEPPSPGVDEPPPPPVAEPPSPPQDPPAPGDPPAEETPSE